MKMKKRVKKLRRLGMASLDYVMVLAVVFPMAFILLQLMVRSYTALHEFITATVGWPIL